VDKRIGLATALLSTTDDVDKRIGLATALLSTTNIATKRIDLPYVLRQKNRLNLENGLTHMIVQRMTFLNGLIYLRFCLAENYLTQKTKNGLTHKRVLRMTFLNGLAYQRLWERKNDLACSRCFSA
jgi:hypothetical protein